MAGCTQSLQSALAAIALMLVLSGVRGDQQQIDDYIRGLQYNRDHVLAYHGERVTATPRQGHLDDRNSFIVVERQKRTLSSPKSDIGVVTSNEHLTYPGSLLLANERLVDNNPDVLAIERAPLTYTINLPGITTEGSFTITPSFSEYHASMNRVLEIWFEKYSKDHDINANFQSVHSFAYSKEELRVKFGLEFKHSDIESNINFDLMEKQESLIMIHKFTQVYYTVSVEPTIKPSDLFGSSVTLEEVRQKTNKKNPPVMVDSVSYGRTIYVKIETSSTDGEAKYLLENKITKFDMSRHDEAEYAKKLKNLAITVYVLGGSTDHIALINAKTFNEVNDIIMKYGKLSTTNQGHPISYSSQFIKDNSRALVNCFTEYIEVTRTEYKSGTVRITHKGWFVMYWEVKWIEIGYDEEGKLIKTEKAWYKNLNFLFAPFSEPIGLPGNAVQISVFASECTGLFWEWWRTVIDLKGIPLIANREFVVWGTTLGPQHSIDPPLELYFQTSSHLF